MWSLNRVSTFLILFPCQFQWKVLFLFCCSAISNLFTVYTNLQCCRFSLFKTKSGLFCNRLVDFFAIWFIVYVLVYFFIFWFIFSFFEDFYVRYQLYPLEWYAWFCRFKENLGKLFYSLLFWVRVCPKITLFVPTSTSILQPLTCHVIDFSHARPYLGYETETLIRVVVCSEWDEESVRNPNDVSISILTLCLL